MGHNVLVEAGAGTGKTTLLVERILFLLLGRRHGKEPCEVTRLVALTFTEKAAAEIKLRLAERLHALSALLGGSPLREKPRRAAERCLEDLRAHFGRKPEEILELAQRALQNLERAQIGTIHAFCMHILRLFPLEAGMDPEFRVDADEEGLRELFEAEWASWLDKELGEHAPRRALWEGVLGRSSLSDLEEMARGLVHARVDLAAAADAKAAAKRLKELAERARRVGEGRPKPRGGILEYLGWLAAHFERVALACLGHRAAQTQAPAANPPAWPANWGEEGRADYEALSGIALRIRPEWEALALEALELLRPFVESLRGSYRRRGWVGFDGLLVGARDLIRDNLKARSELKGRFDAFLVDEFQDTDPLQGEILMFLSEGKESARDWREIRPEPGRLFVVGDPKQSIYRFRGADIRAVESFAAHLERHGGRRCALQTNFRSSSAIVDAVNRVFETAMRPSAGLQSSYLPIRPASPGASQPPEWILVGSKASEPDRLPSADESRRAEAEWIARWILSNRQSYRLGDMALVLRSTSCVSTYLEALRRKGIPYVVEGEKYFFATQEVVDFLNLLKAMDDPSDSLALAGLLRSPLVLLPDAELRRLAKKGLDYRRPGGALEPFYRVLRGLRERASQDSLSELVRLAMAETGIVELSARAYHHQQTVSNLAKLARLAEEACERGRSLKEFIASVSRSVSELREEGESPLADEHLDAVRVLTIHKAKGLEYPVVFLPNLSGTTAARADSCPVRVGWGEPMVGLRLKSRKAANAAMALLEEEESRRSRAEEVRVLYVAMTRPKERLFLLGSASRKKQSPAALIEAGEHIVSRHLPLDFSFAEGEQKLPSAQPAQPDVKRLSALWKERARRLEEARLRTPFTHPTQEPAKDAPVRGPAGSGAVFGRLCHQVLERWDFKLPAQEEPLRRLILSRVRALRREEEADWERLAEECEEVLSAFLRSKAARDLARAEILGRELPFVYEEGGQVVRGTLDLLYSLKGAAVVADYKTDKVPAAKKARQLKRYERQGAFYVRAVERALGLKGVRFRVMFLRDP